MHVMVVDPSRTVLKCVTRLLEAREHQVLPFLDPEEALQCAKDNPNIEALITSAELTSMSGVELCQRTRRLAGHRRSIYIILMSSNLDRHNIVEALDGGADDFINKPPVAEELYARLRAAARLGAMQRELIHQAATDPLTSMPNRRAFFEAAEDICARADETGLCAIMIDIDHFKHVNDLYGHNAGDDAIREIARGAVIEGAVIGRVGGEEFAALLPGRSMAEAMQSAERLRQEIAALRVETEGEILSLTCSFGVSEWKRGDNVDKLLRRADMALYAAKAAGRNRVICADPDSPVEDYPASGRAIRTEPRKLSS